MGNVILTATSTGIAFTQDPGRITMTKPDKSCSYVVTYNSAGYFSFGTSIIGKVINLEWNIMSSVQYEILHDLWESDVSVSFYPNNGEGKYYDAEMLSCNGVYYTGITTGDARSYRKDVSVSILIISSGTS